MHLILEMRAVYCKTAWGAKLRAQRLIGDIVMA
jgi:hypothetical protein